MKRVHRGTLRSHAALSLGASVISAAVTLATLPVILNGVGLDQYGLFTLLALASAYVGVLDFGFSWTTTRFIAEALAESDDAKLDDVLALSLTLYIALGVFGGAALALAAPWLVNGAFNVPDELSGSGVTAARIFALAFPAGMAQIYAASVLRGAQRFDLSSALQAGSAVLTSVALAGVAIEDGNIQHLAAAVALVQAAFAVMGLIAVRWVLPTALGVRRPNRGAASVLGRFTAKVAVSNLGLQLLYIPNRLAVGVLLPLSAVARFTVPLSLAQRLQVVPSGLATAALPTLTASFTRHDHAHFRRTFWRLLAANAALLGPISVLALVWAPTLLTVWFSAAMATDAPEVLRLAVLAVLVNAAASVLVLACDSSGAPGLAARAIPLAGVVNIALAFALTAAFGIVGAAVALAASLCLIVALIAFFWRGKDLPALLPLPWRLDLGRVCAALLGTAVWTVIAFAVEGWIRGRASLVIWTLALLGLAYAGIAGVVGASSARRALMGSRAGAKA